MLRLRASIFLYIKTGDWNCAVSRIIKKKTTNQNMTFVKRKWHDGIELQVWMLGIRDKLRQNDLYGARGTLT